MLKLKNLLKFSDQKLDMKNNSFDFLRLLLAVIVVYGHSWTYGFGKGSEALKILDMHGELAFGGFAVYGFFALSGFLITGSLLRSKGLGDFFYKRFVRIFPGFWACLFVLAFVIAPWLYYSVNGEFWSYYSSHYKEALSYFWQNITLEVRQGSISNILKKNFVGTFNDPFWSLILEFRAYIFVAVLYKLGVFRKYFGVVAVAILMCLSYYMVVFVPWFREWFSIWVGDYKIACLFAYFMVGSVIYLFKDKIIWDWKIFVLLTAIIVLCININQFALFGPIWLGYSLMFLAIVLPFKNLSHKIGDWSFGVYIYSAPIQQLLTSFEFSKNGYWIYVLASITLSLLAGFLSWNIVEKHFLKKRISN
jgi:peptidoglycan/LPS O-acetylase OafA/YrhL